MFKTSKEDYKKYVYVRIPIEDYEKIIKGEIKPNKSNLEAWRFNYEIKQSDKAVYAKRASKIKHRKTIQKLYKALEQYYAGLFKEEKELNPNKLSKLAKVNYKTASKFWKEHNLNSWIKKFKSNPVEELKNFKILELSDTLI